MAQCEEYVSRYSVCVNCNNEAVDCGKEKCPVYKAPTAKVVPSERLENAMKLLDKTEDELYEARGEIEKLTTELEAMRGAANSLKMHYENATADVVPKSEYDAVVSAVDNSTEEFLKLHDDYQKQLEKNAKLHSQMAKYQLELQNSQADVARKIFENIEREIKEALKSNYNAKSERLKSACVDMADEFIGYCEGKIDALRGLQNFINVLKRRT